MDPLSRHKDIPISLDTLCRSPSITVLIFRRDFESLLCRSVSPGQVGESFTVWLQQTFLLAVVTLGFVTDCYRRRPDEMGSTRLKRNQNPSSKNHFVVNFVFNPFL